MYAGAIVALVVGTVGVLLVPAIVLGAMDALKTRRRH